MKILYFLEDRAQERFVIGLVDRVALEEGVDVSHDVRAARRGSKALKEFKQFVGDLKRTRTPLWFELLIVAIDGNCKGPTQRSRDIEKSVAGTPVESRLITCIPDPHIERWYLLDLGALQRAVGRPLAIDAPTYKCKRDFYKQLLKEALRPVGSLFGGAEYGEKIAREVDFRLLERQNAGFERFVSELRRAMRSFKRP